MAYISDCGMYRYWLERSWQDRNTQEGMVLFIMLNPSTADAEVDDAAIRRLKGFTKRWGYSGFKVANLYALRSTKPEALKTHPFPVGPENDYWLEKLIGEHELIVCAWGNNATSQRVRDFMKLAASANVSLHCLGQTKRGRPRHPLYVKYEQVLKRYEILTD